jgi:signal peptidase II
VKRSRIAGLAVALLVLAADQASKAWIVSGLDLPELGSVQLLPVLNLTWVENRGITFGLLNGVGSLGPVILTLVALAVVAALLAWLWRAERMLVAVALGTVAGGAVGNVIDRLRLGYVVDFIHAHAWGWSWYVFNVADAAIVCGVGALVLEGIIARPSAGPARDHLADGPDRR